MSKEEEFYKSKHFREKYIEDCFTAQNAHLLVKNRFAKSRRDADYLLFEKILHEQKKRIEELTIERDLYKQLKDELVEQLVGISEIIRERSNHIDGYWTDEDCERYASSYDWAYRDIENILMRKKVPEGIQ